MGNRLSYRASWIPTHRPREGTERPSRSLLEHASCHRIRNVTSRRDYLQPPEPDEDELELDEELELSDELDEELELDDDELEDDELDEELDEGLEPPDEPDEGLDDVELLLLELVDDGPLEDELIPIGDEDEL